jgi:hypothetical protein
MSVVNAANGVAVMRAAAVVVGAVSAPKAALSGRLNGVLSVAKAAPIHVAKAVLRAAQNALPPKAVQKVAVKGVAVQIDPVKLALTCALRANPAAKVNLAAKAVVTAPAVNVQNAQTVVNVVPSAPAPHATQPKKSWPWPTKRPWRPLREVK